MPKHTFVDNILAELRTIRPILLHLSIIELLIQKSFLQLDRYFRGFGL